jgi:hypothetical protein
LLPPPAGNAAQAGSRQRPQAALWGKIAQLRIGWVAEFLSKPIVTGFLLLTGKP